MTNLSSKARAQDQRLQRLDESQLTLPNAEHENRRTENHEPIV